VRSGFPNESVRTASLFDGEPEPDKGFSHFSVKSPKRIQLLLWGEPDTGTAARK